jgi:hypothetical protein
MVSGRPQAAYAARLLERQDILQAEANRLVEGLDLAKIMGRAGRFERLGSSVSGLMVWRDIDLGASCGRLSPEQAWETMLPLAAHPRTTRLDYRNETGQLTPPSCRGTGATTSWRTTRPRGATSGRLMSLCGRRRHRRVCLRTQRICGCGSPPKRGSRSCGSRMCGTGCPPTPIR